VTQEEILEYFRLERDLPTATARGIVPFATSEPAGAEQLILPGRPEQPGSDYCGRSRGGRGKGEGEGDGEGRGEGDGENGFEMGSTGALHRETGTQNGAVPRSLTTKVIEPLTVSVFDPIKLMFPPAPNVTGPLMERKVAISPAPRPDWMVVIGVVELSSPTVCAPPMLIVESGERRVVMPEVTGRLAPPANRLSLYTTAVPLGARTTVSAGPMMLL
jgi:hypothetical protein